LTTDACTTPDCTAASFVFGAGTCLVSQGKCDIRSTIESNYGLPLFVLGRGYDVELGEICLNNLAGDIVACGGIRLGSPSFTGISPTPTPTPAPTPTPVPHAHSDSQANLPDESHVQRRLFG
jgi:hypothetical protein